MRVLCFAAALTTFCVTASANPSVLLNGSVEDGSGTSPSHWIAASEVDAVWHEGAGRTGARSLHARGRKNRAAWSSEAVTVDSTLAYRADAWVRVIRGKAWLEGVVLDAGGAEVDRRRSPVISNRGDWSYVAVAIPSSSEVKPLRLRLELFVKGEAQFDDLSLRDASPALMANPGIETEVDNRGRIPYWSEEAQAAIESGERSGTLARIADGAIHGGGSLSLTATGAWYAASTIPYARPGWSDVVELRGDVRCGSGAKGAIGILWTDDAQKVVRIDRSDWTESQSPVRCTTGQIPWPDGATIAKPFAVVHRSGENEASAVFDNFRLLTHETDPPKLLVLVNQVGYERKGPKSITVVSSHCLGANSENEVRVVNTNTGRAVLRAPLACRGRMFGQGDADWGWYVWRADVSELDADGTYVAEAELGGVKSTSVSFQVREKLLFTETIPGNVDFFHVQRCGIEIPGWHAACHMDGAKFVKDGTHKDLTGGYHSAGDYNKLQWEYGDGGVMYAMVSAAEAGAPHLTQFNRDGAGLVDVWDEAWWGAKYISKLQIPETGGLPRHIEQGPDRKTWMNWCPPEKMTDNIVGTADDPIVIEGDGHSPLAIGAMARLGAYLTSEGIANDYIDRARRLWNYESVNGTSIPSPLVLISSVDLYNVTRDEAYLDYARRNVKAIIEQDSASGLIPGGYDDSGDVPAASIAWFALNFPDDPLTPLIRTRLDTHLPRFIARASNPLGIAPEKSGPDGYIFNPTSVLGVNYYYACQAWSAILGFRVTGNRDALEFAMDQLDFILGRNTYNLCMMEGLGTVNPPRYHHRYITIPGHPRGAVPGAIPNGFVRDVGSFDRPGFDLSTAGRLYPSYRTSEPWLVHNVFYTLAVTALHESVQGEVGG